MKAIIYLITFLFITSNIAYSQHQRSKQAFLNACLGNWYLPSDNSWDYGFFEDFTIYKGERWNYGSVFANQQNYQIELLSDNGQKLILSVKKDNDSTLLINSGISQKEHSYKKVDKFLPPYSGEDQQKFYDSKYSRIDTAHIRGYLRNNTSSAPYKISTYDRITGEYNYFGDVDSLGFFDIKVPLLNTHQVYLDWGRSTIVDVLEPNESYFIFHDLKTKETIIYGDNARLHNELVAYIDYTKNNNIRPKSEEEWHTEKTLQESLGHDSYLDLMLTHLDTLRHIDNHFIHERAPLLEKTKYYIAKNTDFSIGSDLLQRRFRLDNSKQERFSSYYMHHVDSIFYMNEIIPASLVREYFTFLTDYVGYQSDKKGKIIYNSIILNDLVEREEIQADDTLKKYISVLARLDSEGYASKDIKERESMLAVDTTLQTQFMNLLDTHTNLIEQLSRKKLSLDDENIVNRQYLSPELADAFYVQGVFELIKRNPIPLDPIFLKEISPHIQNPFLKQLITDKNQQLISLSNQDLKYQEHLIRTNHLKNSKDADELLASILEPHKGKVVYIDFWGTWCAPCITEMSYVPSLKKATEGMEVVYIYFANRTPQNTWQNFIKDKKLEGDNVFHYNLDNDQQRAIEIRLGVNGFPTYILVNKKGEFVHYSAPRPSQQTQLITEMKKLLNQ